MLATISKSFERADKAYRGGDFSLAEEILENTLLDPGNSPLDEEKICDCLAALACEQGLYASAAYWYLHVLQYKGSRLQFNDTEMKDAVRNYRILRNLSKIGHSFNKLTA
jgi:hypothetical protein